MDFKLKSDDEVKAILNLLMWCMGENIYFSDNELKIESIYTELSISDNKKKYKLILDNYIYNNIEKVNTVFLNFSILDTVNFFQIKPEEAFSKKMKKLICFASDNSIPVVKFHKETAWGDENNFKYFPRYSDDNDRLPSHFVRFVDVKREYLLTKGISISNQLINFLAHEFGHAMDEKIDSVIFADKDYRVKREINAWDIAKRILKQLNINDTEIDLQKKLCVNEYLEKF